MADGLAGEGFDVDLRYGQAREDALVQVFLRSRVEVKSDRQAARTGNVFVEFKQKGRPSGLAVTMADWWAFELVGLAGCYWRPGVSGNCAGQRTPRAARPPAGISTTTRACCCP